MSLNPLVFLIGIHSMTEQPLQCMELQEKESQKD